MKPVKRAAFQARPALGGRPSPLACARIAQHAAFQPWSILHREIIWLDRLDWQGDRAAGGKTRNGMRGMSFPRSIISGVQRGVDEREHDSAHKQSARDHGKNREPGHHFAAASTSRARAGLIFADDPSAALTKPTTEAIAGSCERAALAIMM